VREGGRSRRDAGLSLLEVLVAVALLGIGVVAMLTTLDVIIKSTAAERDYANAHAWLQSASDSLYRYERVDCTDFTREQVEAAYQAVVETAQDPEGWFEAGGSIEIVPPVLYWDGDVYQDVCYDDQSINLQLVEIQVTNPDGRIVETVQLVKG
jgi:prepilin-type N-terminal cleavage/methylation domain-containing protein